MTFVSIVADASTQSGTATPAWLVPVITGAAGLFGTIIGGTITFLSTRSADKRKEIAETKRQNNAQIKDVSVKFLAALSKLMSIGTRFRDGAEDQYREWEAIMTRANDRAGKERESDTSVKEGGTTEEQTTAASPDPADLRAIQEDARVREDDPLAEAVLVRDLLKGMAALDEALSVELDSLLNEMSLILPNSTVHKAQKAAGAVFERAMTAYLPKDQRPDRSIAHEATNDFISDIRALMGLNPFEDPSRGNFAFSSALLKDNHPATTDQASSPAGQA